MVVTFLVAIGTGLAIDEPDARAAHESFLSTVGRMRACIDPSPSERVHDVVWLGGRATVRAADPRGRMQPVAAADSERILAGVARYGQLSLSHGVAGCLGLLDGLGLPVDPALAAKLGVVTEGEGGWRLAARGAAFDGALVTWNGELRDLVTIDRDAEWIADEGLARDDVRAINAAVHDLFEIAWSHALVVRVGRPVRAIR